MRAKPHHVCYQARLATSGEDVVASVDWSRGTWHWRTKYEVELPDDGPPAVFAIQRSEVSFIISSSSSSGSNSDKNSSACQWPACLPGP